ncbi:MAG: N-acetyl-lysine deacetylase [Steroidobacteraceae bacterium]|nr:N-acetyl-lysine deacetylase [Steroidobacteraceae bacterium]
MDHVSRRDFVQGTLGAGMLLATAPSALAAQQLGDVYAQIGNGHDASVVRLQDWIRQVTIAAENRGMEEGCRYMMQLARDAGFQHVERVPTRGFPSVFATLDAGAKRTLGIYFMYDVKQVDPAEWSSPPWEARLVDKPGLGKVVMGRGAVNQKGPQASFLSALHAIRAAGRKLPVNLVLIAESEEEIGSPHFSDAVLAPQVRSALEKCSGIFMPEAAQSLDGTVQVSLGAKGVVELELVASGEKWGRGPSIDVHSSNRARLDSPAFHLVQALDTLIDAKSDPAIDGWWDKVRPLSAAEEKMLDVAAARMSEASAKKSMGVTHWARDADWRQALEDLAARPTVNIEGLVGGYTGEGGKTVLPHRATAKLDFRLVPDMTREDAVAKLKAHLAKRGFGDIEVNVSGGYDPTTTPADAALIRTMLRVYQAEGVDPIFWPRRGGSWPGIVFTGEPLKLPAAHFGMGHGQHAHAPDEYYLIEAVNPKLAGIDGAVRSFVDCLYALGA